MGLDLESLGRDLVLALLFHGFAFLSGWVAVSILRCRLACLAAACTWRERLGIETRLDVSLNLESLGGDLVLVLILHGSAFLRLMVFSFQTVVGLQ